MAMVLTRTSPWKNCRRRRHEGLTGETIRRARLRALTLPWAARHVGVDGEDR